jgi:putative transposase
MSFYPPYYDLVQGLLILFTVLLVVGGAFRPVLLAPAYLLILLFKPGDVYPFLGTIRFELLTAALILIKVLILKDKDKIFNEAHLITRAAFIFFIIAGISVIPSFNLSYSYDYAYRYLFPLIIFFITLISFQEKIADLRLLIYIYIAVVAYLSWLPIFNFLHGIGVERLDAGIIHSVGETGGVKGHVALANLMTQSLPFCYFLFVNERGLFKKAVLTGFMLLYVIAVVASGSRGGFLGLVVCGVLFVYRSKRRVLTLFLLAGIYILISSYMSGNYLHWMSTIMQLGDSDVSSSSRWDGLRNGIEMCIRRPVLGVGLGCYALARSAWFHWSIWAHNLYGELLGELGLLGAFSWGWLIYLCFREIKRIRDFVISRPEIDVFYLSITEACWAALILRLVIGMVTHSLMIFLWYMIAALLVIVSRRIGTIYPEYQSGGVKFGFFPQSIKLLQPGSVGQQMEKDSEKTFISHEPVQVKEPDKDDMTSRFLEGLSRRNLFLISQKLIGRGISSIEIPYFIRDITTAIDKWCTRDLSREDMRYLFVDRVKFDFKISGETQKASLLVVIGISEKGNRTVLALHLGNKESSSAWKEIFGDLHTRNLNRSGIKLGVMDRLKELEEVFHEEFPGAKIQRCQESLSRSILSKVPKKIKKDVDYDLRSILHASSREKALDLLNEFKRKWEHDIHFAVNALEYLIDPCLTYFDFPEEERGVLRTTNLIKHLNREFRRVMKSMEIEDDESAFYRVLYLISLHMELKWRSGRSF